MAKKLRAMVLVQVLKDGTTKQLGVLTIVRYRPQQVKQTIRISQVCDGFFGCRGAVLRWFVMFLRWCAAFLRWFGLF